MPKFRKMPIEVEAMRYMGPFSADEMYAEWGKDFRAFRQSELGGLVIYTLEGPMVANVGDWIVKGIKGEFYPVKDEIFALTYGPVMDMKDFDNTKDGCHVACGQKWSNHDSRKCEETQIKPKPIEKYPEFSELHLHALLLKEIDKRGEYFRAEVADVAHIIYEKINGTGKLSTSGMGEVIEIAYNGIRSHESIYGKLSVHLQRSYDAIVRLRSSLTQ